jgi:hypothetical protein
MVDLLSGRCAARSREADSADDLLPLMPPPSFGEDLAERCSEALPGMAARSLTMSSFVLPRARVLTSFLSSERGQARPRERCAGERRPPSCRVS